jgi:hypothetical protein
MRRSSCEGIALGQLRHQPARKAEGQLPGMPANSHCRPVADIRPEISKLPLKASLVGEAGNQRATH